MTSEVELNAWDQVVVATRGADVALAIASGQLASGEAALRYRSRSFYDLNGRVVRTEVENRDGATEGVGPWIESTVVYDLLGSPLEVTAEVDATTRLTTTMRYDGNQNLVETIAPEGNRVTAAFDERDLPFTITRGAGTAQASTIQLDYDANGNLVRTLDAEDTDGVGGREESTLLLDGFDRVIEARDAMGNRALTAYDVASQVVSSQVLGHLPGLPGSALVPYAAAQLHHDELGRVFRADAQLFVTPGYTTARPVVLHDQDGDGLVTTRIERDALSRTTHVIEDDGQVTRAFFDGASRLIESRDALGNRLLRGYDPNGNPTRSTSVEVATNGIVPAETFVTRYVFDQLDRLVRVTDNAGHTSRVSYDSRNLTVQQSDPEGPLTTDPLGLYPGQINGPGNTCRYVHDGLGRMIRQVCDLRVGGTGAGALDTSNPRNPDGQIALGYVFDGNSRLTGIVDDNGNRTSFGYDALDRKTSHTFADGKKYEFTYDLDSNVKTVTDPNGSVITKTFDALNRLVQLDVARGAGVVGTTRETYSYDGVSRLVRSTDDNGAVAATQVWEGAYDSLGRMLEERQNGRAVSSRYTGDGKRASVTYAGGRTITRGFDALDRITQLSDVGGPLATSDWIGSGLRELRRLNRNGTQLTFLNDAGNQDLGFDAVQRITRLRVLGAGGPIVDREYGYNRASQRTFEKRNDDHGLTDRYTYDSTYRIVASSFDQDGLPGAVARDLSQVGYRYDGVGNRRDVSKTTTSVGVLAESYGVNALNQYTSVAGVSRDHDENGNLTDDGSKLFTFDYKNRLVGAQRKSDSAPIALYSYLADGRRVRKQVWNPDGGALVRDTRFVLDGAQEVEEQNWSSGATTTTYVWSPVYVDELVEFTNASGSFFAHQDVRCDVVAVTNAAGAVVERRRFDDFGRVEVRDAGGTVVAASPSGCEYGFQGRRLDPETGLVFFRARYYSPETGRFVQRDPVWDAGNVGGQYTFCGNGPGSGRDPFGLQALPNVNIDMTSSGNILTPVVSKFVSDGQPGGLAELETRLTNAIYNDAKSKLAALPPGSSAILNFSYHGSPHALNDPDTTFMPDGAKVKPTGLAPDAPNPVAPAPMTLSKAGIPEFHTGNAVARVLDRLDKDIRSDNLPPHVIKHVVLGACASERHSPAIKAGLKILGVKSVVTTGDYVQPGGSLNQGMDMSVTPPSTPDANVYKYTKDSGTATTQVDGSVYPAVVKAATRPGETDHVTIPNAKREKIYTIDGAFTGFDPVKHLN